MISVSHTASTGVQELFVDMKGGWRADGYTHPPFDVSWYSNISIYHQDVYTGLKKIKPYQNINWPGDITEDQFVEIPKELTSKVFRAYNDIVGEAIAIVWRVDGIAYAYKEQLELFCKKRD